ncbi:MAG: YaeQ family protein [Candidatus Dactylopiibacterium sp.]|nr:YaeQ family protein [Candidatus Dactylopiibacterium sp.]
MALRSTVFKAEVGVADLDRHYYQDHALVLARHPSETDERMMVRLLAFALNASETLEFGRGISSEDEPALWERDLTGAVRHWLEVGQPDERLLRRACGRADRVSVYAYGRGLDQWWQQNAAALDRLDKLVVWRLEGAVCQAMAALAERGMRLQFTIQDGQTLLAADAQTLLIEPVRLGGGAA